MDPRELVENILASRDIHHENGQILYIVTFMDIPNFITWGRRGFLATEENNK